MKELGVVLSACLAVIATAQTPADRAKTSAEKLLAANSVSFTMVVTFPNSSGQIWKVQFLKPNLYKVIAPDQEYRSDGKEESLYLPASKQYQITDRKGNGTIDAPFALGMNQFFQGAAPMGVTDGGPGTIDAKPDFRLALAQLGSAQTTSIYLDSSSDLPLGYDQLLPSGEMLKVRFSDIKLNPVLDPASFAWTPPVGAKPIQTEDLGSKLLRPGEMAPGPTLNDYLGKPVDMNKEFTTHRATLIYFWVGTAASPDLNSLKQLFAEVGGQRLQIIIVYSKPLTPGAQSSLSGLPFQAVFDSKGELKKAYGVQTASEFIVGPDAKVGANFLGYDPDGIAKALRMRGFRL